MSTQFPVYIQRPLPPSAELESLGLMRVDEWWTQRELTLQKTYHFIQIPVIKLNIILDNQLRQYIEIINTL